MKKIEKIIEVFIILIMIFSNIVFATNEPVIYSEGAILIEASTGNILYEKNAKNRFEPASTTKILTALIAIEKCNMNDVVTVNNSALNGIPSNYAIADIRAGEHYTVEQLLNVMLIHSANEVANVIAEHVAGTKEQFANLMNERAKELGCENSNFVNANGIENENHYSTPYDMALIMKECVKNEIFNKIIATEKYTLPATELNSESKTFENNNSLILKGDKYYYEFCKGGKTGYTKEAKNCLVSIASKDGMDLIAVVFKGETTETGESARNLDTINLFEYGYNNYKLITIKKKGETLTSVDIKDSNGDTKQLDVELENDVSVINNQEKLQSNIKPEIKLNIENTPVEKGEVVGTVTYKVNGENYTSNLLASQTIQEGIIENTDNNSNKIIKLIVSIFIIIFLFTILKIKIGSNYKTKRGYKSKNKVLIIHSKKGKHAK